jgi:acyl carrier protein
MCDRPSPVREALDIDSMDFLNFVTAMHRRLGINVPETDYGKLATLDKAVAYFEAKLAEGPTP